MASLSLTETLVTLSYKTDLRTQPLATKLIARGFSATFQNLSNYIVHFGTSLVEFLNEILYFKIIVINSICLSFPVS